MPRHITLPVVLLLVGLAGASVQCTGSASCAKGDFRCSGSMIERCSSGHWLAWSDCAYEGQACVMLSGTASCVPPSLDIVHVTDPGYDDPGQEDLEPRDRRPSDTVSPKADASSLPDLAFDLPPADPREVLEGPCARFESGPEPEALACSVDDTSGLAASGTCELPLAGDLVALCSGRVLISDRVSSRVVEYDIRTCTATASYPMPAIPGWLAHDPTANVLWATLSMKALARIDLETGTTSFAALPAPAERLVTADHDAVFLSMNHEGTGLIARIEGDSSVPSAYWADDMRSILAFDRPGQQLFAMGAFETVARYSFDATARTLCREQAVERIGSNCKEMWTSPDGDYLIVPSGGGNRGYNVSAFWTEDLTRVTGQWLVGAYPVSAVFSTDGKRLLATNTCKLLVFATDDYTQLATFDTDEHASIEKVRISRGGRILYGLAKGEGLSESTKRLYWSRYDP